MKPLTEEKIEEIKDKLNDSPQIIKVIDIVREVEKAHGITAEDKSERVKVIPVGQDWPNW